MVLNLFQLGIQGKDGKEGGKGGKQRQESLGHQPG